MDARLRGLYGQVIVHRVVVRIFEPRIHESQTAVVSPKRFHKLSVGPA
jgi:hypothetical protein